MCYPKKKFWTKQIFNECGFSNIWETELFDNVDYLKCVIKQRLEDQFLQNWNSLVQNSPKSINYKTFADLEQQIINSPSKQDDGRTFQEKIGNVYYVIDPKLEMNTIIFLNVFILTKNVSSHY